MQIYKCDRCGVVFEKKYNRLVADFILAEVYSHRKLPLLYPPMVDFCGICAGELARLVVDWWGPVNDPIGRNKIEQKAGDVK